MSIYTKVIKGRAYHYRYVDGKETCIGALKPVNRINLMNRMTQHAKHKIIKMWRAGKTAEDIQSYLNLVEGLKVSRMTVFNFFKDRGISRTAKMGPRKGKRYKSRTR
jgi:hypothetical protein